MERSPKFPSIDLPEAAGFIEKLYSNAGRTAVEAEISVKTMGYSGLNGTSKSILGALAGYGLIAKEGNKHRVSDLALRIIRPISEEDKQSALKDAALKPPLFNEIFNSNKDCSESVLASLLLHRGFTEDGAARAAKVFKENFVFARLGIELPTTDAHSPATKPSESARTIEVEQEEAEFDDPIDSVPGKRSLAKYSIPLGHNEATLSFIGTSLEPEDFDALKEFIDLFKKQLIRKTEALLPQKNREANEVDI